ncbi:hypothetical protein FDUTEX481_08066 [Tolypothrix sp. PCC 7601]|nr:hypothetical protein FDUTEX481_08066 [Tolypothrix sp. PCC 7601]
MHESGTGIFTQREVGAAACRRHLNFGDSGLSTQHFLAKRDQLSGDCNQPLTKLLMLANFNHQDKDNNQELNYESPL